MSSREPVCLRRRVHGDRRGGSHSGVRSEGGPESASLDRRHAEPNDQPYGDVFFRTSGVNPFIDTEDDPLSTFGLDVDTGSYNVARRYLSDGHLPPAEAIRVEEFVNAFDYGDAAAAGAATSRSTPRARRRRFAAGERYRLVRFSVRARGRRGRATASPPP